jgi:hypothetical protein
MNGSMDRWIDIDGFKEREKETDENEQVWIGSFFSGPLSYDLRTY